MNATAPPRSHPLNVLFTPGERVRQRSKLVRALLIGMMRAGARFHHLRQGVAVRQRGWIHLDIEGLRWAMELTSYCELNWVWRITIGHPVSPYCICERHELTMVSEEITEDLGQDLVGMLRARARGEKSAWPLFDHDSSYPGYAWSQLCRERFTEWRQWRDARREFIKRLNANRV